MTKSPLRFFPEHSSLSRHLERLSSPIQPLILPYHTEQVAMPFTGASSPEPTSPSSGTPLEVEKYFDVAAVVDGLRYNSVFDLSY